MAAIIDRNARILEIETWDDYYLMRIASPGIGREARPGQFVMVKVSAEPFPLLRRPLSIHDGDTDGFSLFFQIAGLGTGILAAKKPGETLDVMGPIGKGFSVSKAVRGKKAFLVGGGRGIAPLYFLARELAARGAVVRVFYGGRCSVDIPLMKRFETAGHPAACSTDDGSFGFKGFVTGLLEDVLDRDRPDLIFACGPDLMMKVIAERALAMGIPAEFSLESTMGCGIGACWGCVHRIRGAGGESWTKICEEGPVFPGDRIVWAEGKP